MVPGTQPVQKYLILSEGPERADPKYGAVRDCLILVPRENTRNPKHLFKRVFLSEAGKHCRLCRTSTKNPKRAPAVRVPRAEENFVQCGIKSKERRNQAVKTRSDWVFKALLLFVGSGLWALAVSHGIGRVDAEAESETQPAPNVIRTQRLEIVNKAGRVVAVLEPEIDGSGGIALYDALGNPRIILSVFMDSPGLILADSRGKPRVDLRIFSDSPGITLYDAQGKRRIHLGVFEGSPSLELFDTREKTRAVLGVTTTVNKVTGAKTTTSEGTLTFFNEEGTVLFQEP